MGYPEPLLSFGPVRSGWINIYRGYGIGNLWEYLGSAKDAVDADINDAIYRIHVIVKDRAEGRAS